jgi:Ca-activated chloride channel family protein
MKTTGKVKVYVSCLMCCLCCFTCSYGQAGLPTAESRTVKVLVTAVSSKGVWVNDLRQSDIRLTDDGRPLAIDDFRIQFNPPTSVSVMIDTSSSQGEFFPLIKSTARVFVKGFIRPGSDLISVISFANEAVVNQPPTDDVRRLREAIDKLEAPLTVDLTAPVTVTKLPKGQKPPGMTGLWDAVRFVCERTLSASPAGARKAILIFTDGDDTSSDSKMRDAIESAAQNDVAVYAIGIPYKRILIDHQPGGAPRFEVLGEVLEREKLRKLSEETGGRAFFPKVSDEMEAILSQIDRDLRHQYTVSFQTEPSAGRGAGRRLKIEVVSPSRKGKVQLSYRRTYKD